MAGEESDTESDAETEENVEVTELISASRAAAFVRHAGGYADVSVWTNESEADADGFIEYHVAGPAGAVSRMFRAWERK